MNDCSLLEVLLYQGSQNIFQVICGRKVRLGVYEPVCNSREVGEGLLSGVHHQPTNLTRVH